MSVSPGSWCGGKRDTAIRKLLIATAIISAACSPSCTSRDTPEGNSLASTTASPKPSSSGGSSLMQVRYSFTSLARRVGAWDGEMRRSWGVTWTDHDGNGYADLFVGRHDQAPELLANDSGRYEPVDQNFVSPEGYTPTDEDMNVDRHGCAWGEATGDGVPDLYCTQGANVGTGSGPNQLLVKTDGRFVDIADRLGVTDPFGRGRSVNWIDHDSDGDLDLFVGNELRQGYPNVLYENLQGKFRPTAVGVDDQLSTVSSSWADWDGDADPDLLVLQYPPHRPVAYENLGGRFRSVSLGAATTAGSWHAAAWGDYDGDGRPDVALMSRYRLWVLRNTESGFRRSYSLPLEAGRMSVWFDAENDGDLDLFIVQGAWRGTSINNPDLLVIQHDERFQSLGLRSASGPIGGIGDSVAAADHDRDGWTDLFETNGNSFWGIAVDGPDVLLENGSIGGQWVAVDIRGTLANPWGMGARILVETDVATYWREVTDGVSYYSQSEVGHLVLGLGESPSARVTVYWSDGTRDCLDGQAGETILAIWGESPCPG